MIDIEDKSYPPTLAEIDAYIGNPLFGDLLRHMEETYRPRINIPYSGDTVLLGWNVQFQRAGRALCRVYPRKGFFPMLLVVEPKEKQRVEALLPSLGREFAEVYRSTKEGMGQRWLLIDLFAPGALYEDAKRVIRIRSESK